MVAVYVVTFLVFSWRSHVHIIVPLLLTTKYYLLSVYIYVYAYIYIMLYSLFKIVVKAVLEWVLVYVLLIPPKFSFVLMLPF